MPGAGGGVFSLRQVLVLLIVVALAVLLVRQVPWHTLLVATGIIVFAAAVGIYVLYPSRKGYAGPGEAFRHGRGTGLWWWLWAYGLMAVYGIGIGLLIVGTSKT